MINSAPALCPEENKNWSPRNCSAVIGWLGWKARHLTTISRVRCETRLISPTSVPIAKKFWLEAICSISWPRFISWEYDHFSSLKLRHLFEKKGPMKIWNHQNASFVHNKASIANPRFTRGQFGPLRFQIRTLVLLWVNFDIFKASNMGPPRPKFRILDLLGVNFWSFCDLNYKFSSNLRSISRQFRLIQSRIFKNANGKNKIYLQSSSTTTKILDANKVSLVKLYRLLTIE